MMTHVVLMVLPLFSDDVMSDRVADSVRKSSSSRFSSMNVA